MEEKLQNFTAEAGLHRAGYVAILGCPNVGKSTLMNNLLQYKLSIVTPKPQTTRHNILGILTGPGYQIVFLDTPGLLQPKYRLQEIMVKSAFKALEEADLVIYMIEAQNPSHEEDVKILEQINQVGKPIILVINKIDLIAKSNLLPLIEFYNTRFQFSEVVPISALLSDGLDILRSVLIQKLSENPPFYPEDMITERPERFFVAEIIREKIFQKYGEEIPYSATVHIEEFKERTEGKDYIRAAIFVERNSQKGILIGKKGLALKEVGKLAREEIETFLGRPVYLELWVGVKEKWRQKDSYLKELGYL